MTVPDPPQALTHGDLEVLGRMPDSSNFTLLARATSGDEEVLVIYKPRRGEAPLWDFPDGTLCQREVAAYELARALGWPNVPPTVLREGPAGEGSVQLFVRFDPEHHFFTLELDRADDFRRVALFDVVANNADRKSGHCLLGDDGRVWVIDHGVCFSSEPKLRTVIWDYAGTPIDDQPLADLRRVRTDLEDGALARRLEPLLDGDERAALAARIDDVVAAPTFPEPDPTVRSFPWPPI